MTQVLIQWEGQPWPLDTEDVTLKQAFVIKDSTKDDQFTAGRNLAAWEIGVKAADPGCVRALYWLMQQQAGQHTVCAQQEFAVIRFHRAYVEAVALAEDDPEVAAQLITVMEAQLEILRATVARHAAASRPAEPLGPTPPPPSNAEAP
jgi:hypothetical protein